MFAFAALRMTLLTNFCALKIDETFVWQVRSLYVKLVSWSFSKSSTEKTINDEGCKAYVLWLPRNRCKSGSLKSAKLPDISSQMFMDQTSPTLYRPTSPKRVFSTSQSAPANQIYHLSQLLVPRTKPQLRCFKLPISRGLLATSVSHPE